MDSNVVGYELPVQAILDKIPAQLNYKGHQFTLRGVVAFDPPRLSGLKNQRSPGNGHFFTYSRRIGGKWQLLDDLRKTIINVKGTTVAKLEMVLYTK